MANVECWLACGDSVEHQDVTCRVSEGAIMVELPDGRFVQAVSKAGGWDVIVRDRLEQSHRQVEPQKDLPPPSDIPESAGLPFTAYDPRFEAWWLAFYGPVDNYTDPDEYWCRKAFAWWGWVQQHEGKHPDGE